MRSYALLALISLPLASAAEARADVGTDALEALTLRVDEDLVRDARTTVALNTQASSLLPFTIDTAESMAAQNRSGGGGGAVSPMGRQFGIGLQVGYPTAISFKYMLAGDQGLQGGVGFFGYGCGNGNAFGFCSYGFAFHLDYLWHLAVLASPPPFVLSFYIGGGGQLGLGAYGGPVYVSPFGPTYYGGAYAFSLAGRIPFGVSFAFNQIPIELFLEITPTIIIFPPLGFTFAPSLGFRFYF